VSLKINIANVWQWENEGLIMVLLLLEVVFAFLPPSFWFLLVLSFYVHSFSSENQSENLYKHKIQKNNQSVCLIASQDTIFWLQC
jgi:hypothetical protein